MSTHLQRARRPLAVAVTAALAAALPVTQATSTATTPTSAPGAYAAANSPADALVVAPGRLGSLRMGTSTSTAKRLGWIARGDVCPGWTAGPRSIKVAGGNEVFKAYPEKVKAGKLLSMWATGEVVTTKGIRTQGIGKSKRRGSSLTTIRSTYPNLRTLGAWTDPPSGLKTQVYSAGNARKGWLDFFVADDTSRLSFVVVRTNDVKWRFKGADGC